MKYRIYVIEDDENIRNLICVALENFGYCASGFETAEEALDNLSVLLRRGREAQREYPAMFVFDWMLPGMDGMAAIRKIREMPDFSAAPVLMLTAKDREMDIVQGLDNGADDYMTKPFSPSELVARVKAHMERYNRLVGSVAVKNDIIEIRGIKIDKTARRIWVNGEEKTFTTKEFDLLTFLAENPNRVFTKAELFRQIWDMESVGDIATVTVHIKKIREKIEFNTAKPQYIETIWGVGYRFKV